MAAPQFLVGETSYIPEDSFDDLQRVDLFAGWDAGVARLVEVILGRAP